MEGITRKNVFSLLFNFRFFSTSFHFSTSLGKFFFNKKVFLVVYLKIFSMS